MPFCAKCGADVTGVRFCASCGAPTDAAAPGPTPNYSAGPSASNTSAPSDGGLTDNMAGALAYFTIIPAILFLVIDPFKSRRFVRFHSFQCLFFSAAAFAFWMIFGVVSNIIGFFIWTIGPLIQLAIFIVWILMVVKAYQGQEFKLPIIGDLAAKQV